MSFGWTLENIETLRTLWAEGKSATEIYKAIGAVSRSAVIGKLHRLKVYRDGPAVRGERKQRRTRSNERRAAYQTEWKRQRREEERLARESVTPEERKAAKKKPKTFVHTGNLQNKRESRKRDPGLPDIAPAAVAAPQSRGLTIMQLTDSTCRWPEGDGAPFLFCGNEPEPGLPYCAPHAVRAFNLRAA